MSRAINSSGLAIIKEYEGLRLEAYQDTSGIWTIGYGHTHGISQGDKCSEIYADVYLRQDCETAEKAVCEIVKAPITDNEFSALVSFTFNLGRIALLKLISHGIDAVPVQILKWDHDDGKVLPGLTKRRQAEAALWSMK